MADKSLQAVLTELRSKQKMRIGPLSEFNMNVKALSTGNIALDAITGVGGIPRGRVIELFGPPSSGKTTTALQAAAKLQQAGGKILYLDYEKALDEVYCSALGLNVYDESFVYMQPQSFEEGANVFRQLLATGEIDLMVADSVASMVTESELAADTGKATMADRAKVMHQLMRQITGTLHTYDCAAVFLNHVLDVVDISPMGQQLKARGVNRKTTPGGMALKFYASLRIEFKQTGNIRSDELDVLTNEETAVVTQTKVQATVVKNKVSEPFRTAELRIRYGRGFSQAYSVLDILVAHKLIKKQGGGIFKFSDMSLVQHSDSPDFIKGEENLVHAIEQDETWLERLEKVAQRVLDEHGAKTVDSSQYDADGDLVEGQITLS